jgi:uncharacterized protein (TIGR00255 family)
MTGFGTSRISSPNVEIEVTIKSLNGRFLEIRGHMPREYGAFEREIKTLVGEDLHRGTVDVYVMRRPRGLAGTELSVDTAAAKNWVKAYRALGKQLSIKSEPNVSQLMAVSEVVSWQPPKAKAGEREILMKAVKKALSVCVSERQREGAALGRHLDKLLDQLGKEVGKIEKLADQARVELGERLKERMARSPFGDKVDAQRLGQELAVYLERADIAEEVHRLKEHLKICHGLLRSEARAGKKLDFYCQELHREVNTIGSKAPVAGLTQIVVEAKSLIEQFKEQVQNIV